MKQLIKSKEEFDAFIQNALMLHESDRDYETNDFWVDIRKGDIYAIKLPRSFPAIIRYYSECSSYSSWNDLVYEWTTKEDLGL